MDSKAEPCLHNRETVIQSPCLCIPFHHFGRCCRSCSLSSLALRSATGLVVMEVLAPGTRAAPARGRPDAGARTPPELEPGIAGSLVGSTTVLLAAIAGRAWLVVAIAGVDMARLLRLDGSSRLILEVRADGSTDIFEGEVDLLVVVVIVEVRLVKVKPSVPKIREPLEGKVEVGGLILVSADRTGFGGDWDTGTTLPSLAGRIIEVGLDSVLCAEIVVAAGVDPVLAEATVVAEVDCVRTREGMVDLIESTLARTVSTLV